MYPVSLHPLHCAASRTQCRCLLAASLDACISLVRNQSNKDSSTPHPVQIVAPACVICLFGFFFVVGVFVLFFFVGWFLFLARLSPLSVCLLKLACG